MRIVIDGRMWGESGLGRYIRNLIKALEGIEGKKGLNKQNEVREYYVLLLERDFEKVSFKEKNFHKVLADFKWYGISEQVGLLKVLRGLKPDLVHFPHFNVPIFYNSSIARISSSAYNGKYVVTIHDLIHQHFSTREATTRNPLIYAVKKFGYKKVFGNAIKKASKIITPSEFVKKCLVNEWGIKKDKIAVTYEGVDEGVIREIGGLSEKGEESFKHIVRKFNINKPYIFYIGNAQPHKNLLRLIRVFKEIRKKYPDLQLVLAGPEHEFWDRVRREISEEGEIGIKIIGFISDEEMVVLYKSAEAYIQPSLEEGFGIPVLEAMACGCPVVSSNAASLPEVGGDAAIYFDPKDENDMVEKISQVLNDEKLRNELIDKGEKRYKEFSWEKMASETLEVYESIWVSS